MPIAYVFTEYGGPDHQRFADIPKPVPGSGEALVAVRAAGVNPVDWKIRTGELRGYLPLKLPAVLGRAVAGVVEAVGPNVDQVVPGDAVLGSNPSSGGYAEYVVVPAAVLAVKPPGVSFTDAATLPVSSATAYDGLLQLDLPAGSTLLVTGAGGGIGVVLAQLAAARGLTVVGTAGPGKRDLLGSLGVRHVRSDQDVASQVAELAPDGVDGVFDLAGGAALAAVAGFAPAGDKLISAGDEAVERYGGRVVDRARAPAAAVLTELVALVSVGKLRPLPRIFAFADAAAALEAVESGHAAGKVVIEIGGHRPR